jgi:hypothetical protein
MENGKVHSSRDAFVHVDSEIEQVNHNVFFHEEKVENSLSELNPQLAALNAAHKGMHPVLLTLLAALHKIS